MMVGMMFKYECVNKLSKCIILYSRKKKYFKIHTLF